MPGVLASESRCWTACWLRWKSHAAFLARCTWRKLGWLRKNCTPAVGSRLQEKGWTIITPKVGTLGRWNLTWCCEEWLRQSPKFNDWANSCVQQAKVCAYAVPNCLPLLENNNTAESLFWEPSVEVAVIYVCVVITQLDINNVLKPIRFNIWCLVWRRRYRARHHLG